MESNPFQFLEGVALAAYAVGANTAYVYLRGEFWRIAEALDRKIAEMEAAGYLGAHVCGTDFALKIFTHLGAGAYICGEETAMLELIEGQARPAAHPPAVPGRPGAVWQADGCEQR